MDWDRIATFTFSIGQQIENPDLRLEDYVAAVETSRVRELDHNRLVAHRVSARDGDGALVARWSVFRSLFGEFELDGAHYVLDDGHYFVVATDYLDELNGFIEGIPAPVIDLPPTTATTLEDAYNAAVAAAGADRLLLDEKTIRPAARTTRIEICDIMTSAGELIHVKRKLGSSDLSHLFSQGYVSAETIHAGPDFRAAVRAKIDEEAASQQREAATFSALIDEPFSPQVLTVVYAVLADWQGKLPRNRLPFSSKVNLRHHAQQLSRMGFKLRFAAVDAI